MSKVSTEAILRVGVTGGIGSGKSTVCAMFAKHGIPVLSADEIARELMQKDDGLRSKLSSLLGASAYSSDGTLDRPYVAAKIFSDKSIQKKINALVHPRVETEIDARFASLAGTGSTIGIVEAALIYEAGYDKRLDVVVVVDAPESDRVRRVVARDQASGKHVKDRMAAQSSPSQKAKKADYVIHNKGSLSQLESSVRFLLTVLQTIAKDK